MYLTSTQLSKNKKYRDCRVFHVSNLKTNPDDVTNQVADRFGLEYTEGRIRIYFGSGTGSMVLKQLLEQYNKDPMNHSLKVFVADVSVF